MSAQVHSQVGRKGVERSLGRTVSRAEAGDRHSSKKRRDVDQMSLSAFNEVGDRRLHSINRGFDVDGHHLIHVFVAESKNGSGYSAAGVVDPHIYPPEFRQSPVAQVEY